MTRLSSRYSGLVCDLDGVVYRGRAAVPGAPAALAEWQRGGGHVVFATNNASRPPHDVLQHLAELGIDASLTQVLTSAQVGAAHLATLLVPGSAVLAVGGPGVAAALVEVGLAAEATFTSGVRAVLQGYGPQVRACDLSEAAFAVQAGAPWVATNLDRTIPTGGGIGPGNGTLVDAVAAATSSRPIFVGGKPDPAMALASAQRMGLSTSACLAVGDRLDTDILGGARADMDTLWVLSGVHQLADLLAHPQVEPTYVADDLTALARDLTALREVRRTAAGVWACGAAEVSWRGSTARVRGSNRDDLLAAATAAVLAWRADLGADAGLAERVHGLTRAMDGYRER